jgi:hypothetical protein
MSYIIIANAQTIIKGQILDAETGSPVPFVVVGEKILIFTVAATNTDIFSYLP